MDFFREAMGINTTTGGELTAKTPGLSLDPATGVVTIVGNVGTANDLAIDAGPIGCATQAALYSPPLFTPTESVQTNSERPHDLRRVRLAKATSDGGPDGGAGGQDRAGDHVAVPWTRQASGAGRCRSARAP